MGIPGGTVVKNSPVNVGEFNPWIRKIPWRRKWQSILIFLPGKSRGQRSLAGYSPWGHNGVRQDLATKVLQIQLHNKSFHFSKAWEKCPSTAHLLTAISKTAKTEQSRDGWGSVGQDE